MLEEDLRRGFRKRRVLKLWNYIDFVDPLLDSVMVTVTACSDSHPDVKNRCIDELQNQ